VASRHGAAAYRRVRRDIATSASAQASYRGNRGSVRGNGGGAWFKQKASAKNGNGSGACLPRFRGSA